MPRAPRIEYAGAVYHVVSRGQRQDAIVYDDEDRRTFFDTLSEVCERTGWRLHAWVLMRNHYHWLLETPEPNLVAGMKWFQTTYSTRFRLRHGLVGHVMQGRYKAMLVEPDSDTYFQTVSSYIHLNPVRARGMLKEDEPLQAYVWSSYPVYLKPRGRRPSYLVVDRVLGNLGLADDGPGRRRYMKHVNARCQEIRSGQRRQAFETEWKPLRRGWCLGGKSFRAQMLDRVEETLKEKGTGVFGGEVIRDHNERAAQQRMDRGLKILGVSGDMLPQLKKTDDRKRAIAWWIRTETTVSNRWVADALHMGHEVNVSASVRLVQQANGNALSRMRRQLERST